MENPDNAHPAPARGAIRPRQFSLATILVIVFVYAFALSLAICTSLPIIQVLPAMAALTLFAGLDLTFHRRQRMTPSRFARVSMFLAYYATAFSFATIACLVVFLLTPETHMEMLSQRISGPGFALPAVVVLLLLAYVAAYSIFSTLAFIASLLVFRRFRLARWLALINSPGPAIVCLLLVGMMLEKRAEAGPAICVEVCALNLPGMEEHTGQGHPSLRRAVTLPPQRWLAPEVSCRTDVSPFYQGCLLKHGLELYKSLRCRHWWARSLEAGAVNRERRSDRCRFPAVHDAVASALHR